MAKTSSDALFSLVVALDASEKRFFKRYAAKLPGGAQSSVRLFDAISKQQAYDERALKRSETYLSGFAQQKRFLYQLLLRALRERHAGSSSALRIRELLSDAEMLRRKRLFRQAFPLLKKAQAIAEQAENESAQLEIANQLDDLRFDAGMARTLKTNREEFDNEQRLLARLKETSQFKLLAKDTYFFHQRFHNMPDKQARLRLKNLLKGKGGSKSLRGEWYGNNSRAAYHLALGEFSQALGVAARNVRLFERHPHWIADAPHEYVKALSTFLVLQDVSGNYAQTAATIEKLRKLPEQMPTKLHAHESHIFVYTYTTEFNSLCQQLRFDETLKLIPHIEKGLRKYKAKIQPAQETVFYYNFAVSCLYAGELRAAYRWARAMLDTAPGERIDLEYVARWILLLATYERGDKIFFRRLLKKEGNFLLHMRIGKDLSRSLLRFLDELQRCDSRKEKIVVLETFREKLKRTKWSVQAQQALQQFNLAAWVNGQLEKKKIVEILKRN